MRRIESPRAPSGIGLSSMIARCPAISPLASRSARRSSSPRSTPPGRRPRGRGLEGRSAWCAISTVEQRPRTACRGARTRRSDASHPLPRALECAPSCDRRGTRTRTRSPRRARSRGDGRGSRRSARRPPIRRPGRWPRELARRTRRGASGRPSWAPQVLDWVAEDGPGWHGHQPLVEPHRSAAIEVRNAYGMRESNLRCDVRHAR